MACDSCGDAASDRFDASYEIAFPVFRSGLLAVLLVLIAAWGLPWQRRHGVDAFATTLGCTAGLAEQIFAEVRAGLRRR
ncbi:hypothetical protein [Streptomyces sp. H34-S4]|uniref:hypothetical protein n=1 Tax=Streptomyces sp. H34-S4 TaxID=2996463 RepID=UPI002271AF53|nr:hypothetical protein [Streptomyces sp. H34-S4]MCY0933030.1 hypothetical protein [Streptomyces sp. H34-S4]